MLSISDPSLFLAHIFSCFFLTGLIWVIQLVHYPSFHFVKTEDFKEFEAFHASRISLIVMPFMILELISGGYILFSNFSSPETALLLKLNFVGILGIWISTFLLSVPCHNILSKGHNTNAINRLVTTNWIRTLLWTLRSGLLIYLLLSF